MAPKRATRSTPATTTTITSVTNAQHKALIDQGIADALAACNADKSINGDDNHNSGTAPPVVTMANNHTMAQLLEAPTEGYEDAIVVPEITADNFELKHGTDIAKITRKWSKPDKHGHGNGKECTRARRMLSKCMRTRRSNYLNNSNVTIPRRRIKQVSNIVEPEIRTIVTPMAERTMEELLRAPTEGYGEAIVLPEINADHFEIKTNLLQLVQANPFNGRENENPHAHINSFKRITSTLRFRNVPNDVIKI
ncbi:hypothetical protein Tco_0838436 [Tanacetum coccineum]|uniref:Reverse transcriptase domain-containing protein n=1 Tax=Tanacetum coccineum TaxID=301880 RepID=A0ABQ5ASB2_9ASTR